MKRVMIVITMMLPLMTFASLFSERSGEIFQATREGPGELSLGLFYVGVLIPPVGLATVPAGIAVAAVDELVVSPVVDLCCLPYDLAQPRHGFVLRVRDADGKPVAGARFFANMSTRSHIEDVIRETTDEKGEIFIPKLNHVALKFVTISADGCYDYREYDGPWHCVYEKQPGEDGRIVLDFVMKRKIRPVEKVKAAIEIPDSLRWQSAEIFFDCEKGDWLPPHGKGCVPDLKLTKSFEGKDAKKPQAAYRQTIRIEAVGKGNGFLCDTCNWYDGMPGAYQIPATVHFDDKPEPAVYCWYWDGDGSTGTKGFDRSTYYCLRLRTRFAENGRVVGAHYGKLFFHHGIGSLAQTLFVCAENELWLE